MSKLPSMPFVVADYMADTTYLSLEEHGAYLLILFNMWRHEGYLPDIDADNARLLGVPVKHWLKLKARLAPFLIAANGRLTQKRLQIQWNWAIENRNKQAERGKKGGRANAEKIRALAHVKRSASEAVVTAAAVAVATPYAQAEKAACKKERIIPTTYQEDRGEEVEFTGVHRLLKTPAMRRTG